jgi:hypothetical protein
VLAGEGAAQRRHFSAVRHSPSHLKQCHCRMSFKSSDFEGNKQKNSSRGPAEACRFEVSVKNIQRRPLPIGFHFYPLASVLNYLFLCYSSLGAH